MDELGYAYVAGTTSSDSSIATSGSFQSTYGGGGSDGFLQKRGAGGTILWTTYIGGSLEDAATGVATLGNEQVLLVGWTRSPDLPRTSDVLLDSAAGGRDVFLALFDPDGDLLWSARFGGASDESPTTCAFDPNGRILVAGHTASSGFLQSDLVSPLLPQGGGMDGFVARIDTALGLLWSTYYGGSGDDEVADLDIAEDGSLHICGTTESDSCIAVPGTWQPLRGDSTDAFVARFTPSGTLSCATYLGGPGRDGATGIAILDGADLLVGSTSSDAMAVDTTVFRWQRGGATDGFLARFDSLDQLTWFTYLGGEGPDMVSGLDLRPGAELMLAGTTASDTGIATAFAEQPVRAGLADAFLVVFDAEGHRDRGTYIGGPMNDSAFAIAASSECRNPVVGATASAGGIADHAVDPDYSGNGDGLIANIGRPGCCGPCSGILHGEAGTAFHVCPGESVQVATVGGDLEPGYQWAWYMGGCGDPWPMAGAGDSVWLTSTDTTVYFVRGEGPLDTTACLELTVIVEVPPQATIYGPSELCSDLDATLTSGDADQTIWSGPFGLGGTNGTLDIPAGMPVGTLEIELVQANGYGCSDTAHHAIEILPVPVISLTGTAPSCFGSSDGSAGASSSDGQILQYHWVGWGGSSYDSSITDLPGGTYTVVATNAEGCTTAGSIELIEPDELITDVAVTPAFCSLATGQIAISTSIDPSFLSFTWSPPVSTLHFADALPFGGYFVLVSDTAGCSSSAAISVPDSGAVLLFAPFDTLWIDQGSSVVLNMDAWPLDLVDSLYWSPASGLDCSSCLQPTASPDSTTSYTLNAMSTLGCQTSQQVVVVVRVPCPDLFLPNVFSPNGDGINDELCIRGACPGPIDLRIYDRWGNEVFSAGDPAICWDGSIHGTRARAGTYAFVAMSGSEHGAIIRKGMVTLLR